MYITEDLFDDGSEITQPETSEDIAIDISEPVMEPEQEDLSPEDFAKEVDVTLLLDDAIEKAKENEVVEDIKEPTPDIVEADTNADGYYDDVVIRINEALKKNLTSLTLRAACALLSFVLLVLISLSIL